jgi:hypothetical protein
MLSYSVIVALAGRTSRHLIGFAKGLCRQLCQDWYLASVILFLRISPTLHNPRAPLDKSRCTSFP